MRGCEDAANAGRLINLKRSVDAVALPNKSNVHQNNIGARSFGHRGRLVSGMTDADDIVTAIAQIAFNRHRDKEFVFDQQDADGRSAGRRTIR